MQPFKIGDKVVAICSFDELSKVWGISYPEKGQVVVVKAIRRHPIHNFWLIDIDECVVELCHKSFRCIEYSDLTAELASQVTIGDTADLPVKQLS